MDVVKKDDFDSAEDLPEVKEKKPKYPGPTESEFQAMLESMQNPVEAQKHLAVKIKAFLDKRIAEEMQEKGFLSDHTRRWVESYNSILDKIQKSLYGDKSVNLHVHKISHSQIASKIREVEIVNQEDDKRRRDSGDDSDDSEEV